MIGLAWSVEDKYVFARDTGLSELIVKSNSEGVNEGG